MLISQPLLNHLVKSVLQISLTAADLSYSHQSIQFCDAEE